MREKDRAPVELLIDTLKAFVFVSGLVLLLFGLLILIGGTPEDTSLENKQIIRPTAKDFLEVDHGSIHYYHPILKFLNLPKKK